MLTAEDKEDIRRIVAEAVLATALSPDEPRKDAERIEFGPMRYWAKPLVEVAARAIEVLGSREKAWEWLNSPVRSLGDRTPLSLLETPEGVAKVQDTLGRVEHGIW